MKFVTVQLLSEQSYELGAAVGDNMLREAVELPDVVKKESGRPFRCDRRVRRNEVYSLGDRVYYGHDGVMSGGLQKFDHEIDTKHIPPCVQNGERLEFANRRVSPGFRPEAEITGAHILTDIPRHLRPPVVLGHQF